MSLDQPNEMETPADELGILSAIASYGAASWTVALEYSSRHFPKAAWTLFQAALSHGSFTRAPFESGPSLELIEHLASEDFAVGLPIVQLYANVLLTHSFAMNYHWNAANLPEFYSVLGRIVRCAIESSAEVEIKALGYIAWLKKTMGDRGTGPFFVLASSIVRADLLSKELGSVMESVAELDKGPIPGLAGSDRWLLSLDLNGDPGLLSSSWDPAFNVAFTKRLERSVREIRSLWNSRLG